MASKSLSLSIRPRGNMILCGRTRMGHIENVLSSNRLAGKPLQGLPSQVSLSASASTADLYESIAATAHSSVHRLRISKGSDGSLIPNARTIALESTGLREQSSVYVKDLGEAPSLVLPVGIFNLTPLVQTSRPPDSLAHRLPGRIPWAHAHSPTALLSPIYALDASDPLRHPHHPALFQARARDPFHSPLLRRYDAAVKHLQE